MVDLILLENEMRLFVLPLLIGCQSGIIDSGPDDKNTDETGQKEDTGEETDPPPWPSSFSDRGPSDVSTKTGTSPLSTGCDMKWTSYIPAKKASSTIVMLAHGFSRGQEQMAGWAEHWASWGFTVFTPDLCHASLWDTDHDQNGKDLEAFATFIGEGAPIAYVGQSAGGLAALLAASTDPNAQLMLGLDPVDNDNSGANAATSTNIPIAALVGISGQCNSNQNGASMMQKDPGSRVFEVTDADHCDFESPTNALCTSFCSNRDATRSDEDIQTVIRTLSTAWIAWHSTLEPQASRWWDTEDDVLLPYLNAGDVQPL